MPATEGNVTRCDIRVPNDLYQKLEDLAVLKGAKIHHRSGKPEVTGTILELLKLGLRYQDLSDHLPDRESNKSDLLFDHLPDYVVTSEKLETAIASVSLNIDNRISELKNELQPILDNQKDLEQLMGK